MATLAQLEQALVKADQAGNVEDAQRLANEIKRLRAEKEFIETQYTEGALTTGQRAADIAKAIPAGAAKGMIGLAGLPGEIQRGAEFLTKKTIGRITGEEPITQYFDILGRLPSPSRSMSVLRQMTGGGMPTTEQVRGAVELIPGAKTLTRFQPTTPAGEYAQTISEFIVPAAPFVRGPRSAMQLGAVGVASGATQETAEQLGLPVGVQIPLTLSVGMLTGYLTSPSRAAYIANQALKGADDAELAVAIQLEKDLTAAGYKITAPELIDNKVIQRLAVDIYGTEKGGQIMYNYLKNRPQELSKISQRLLDEVADNPESLRQVYEKIGTTAKKAIVDAKKERTITSQNAGYTISNKEFVPDNEILVLIDKIDDTVKQLPKGSPTARKLNQLKTRLTKSSEKVQDEMIIVDDSGLPLSEPITKQQIVPQTNVNILDSALKEFRKNVDDFYLSKSLKEPTFINKETVRLLSNSGKTGVLDDLDKILRTNKNYDIAKNTFKKLNDEIVVPVQKNVKELAKGEVTPAKIKSFIFDPTKNNVNDIKATYTILNKTDSEAFPQLARVYIENATNKAYILKEGGQSAKEGFNLYKALAGTKAQEKNLNAVLRGVAEAKGINPNDLILGWRNFNEVLKRTGRIVNIDSPGTPVSTQFLPRDIAQIGSFMWRVKFAGKLDEALQERAIKQLADVFTKQNSVEELVALGRTAVGSSEAIKRVVQILAITDPLRETTIQQFQPSTENLIIPVGDGLTVCRKL